MEPLKIRNRLVEALRLDLVGPDKGSSLETEILAQRPSAWYLTGFLVPLDADEDQRADETGSEEISQGSDAGDLDDAGTPEPPAARRTYFPSSIGLSLLVPSQAKKLQVTARWGDYQRQGDKPGQQGGAGSSGHDGGEGSSRAVWKRAPREQKIVLHLPEQTKSPLETDIPQSNGLKLALSVRPVQMSMRAKELVPDGVRSVSVFLVNRRKPAPDETKDEQFAFQAELVVEADCDFIPRPNLGGLDSDDWDERLADLQYRDACEVAVGHGVSTLLNIHRPRDRSHYERFACYHESFYRSVEANRSMRDVEPSVNVWLRNLDNVEIEGEDEA